MLHRISNEDGVGNLFIAAFDESGKKDDSGFVVFGGFLFRAALYPAFCQRWVDALSAKGIKYLSMKEAMCFRGEFADLREKAPPNQDSVTERNSLLLSLATIADENSVRNIVSPCRSSDFRARSKEEQKAYGDIWYCAFEGVTKRILSALPEHPSVSIHLLCDNSEEYSGRCLNLYQKMRSRDPRFKRVCEMIAFCEDERMPGIQAADMVSYVTRQVETKPDGPIDPVVAQIYEIFNSRALSQSELVYHTPELGTGALSDPT